VYHSGVSPIAEWESHDYARRIMKQSSQSRKNQSASLSNPLPPTSSGSLPAPDELPEARTPGYEEVSQRAYEIWEKSGFVDGQHLDHWYEAERQLQGARSNEVRTEETRSVNPDNQRHEAA
jgi:DUF2934 family protein